MNYIEDSSVMLVPSICCTIDLIIPYRAGIDCKRHNLTPVTVDVRLDPDV